MLKSQRVAMQLKRAEEEALRRTNALREQQGNSGQRGQSANAETTFGERLLACKTRADALKLLGL